MNSKIHRYNFCKTIMKINGILVKLNLELKIILYY